MRYTWKRTIITWLATALALMAAFALKIGAVDKFPTLVGEKTYYLDDTSSQALQKDVLGMKDVFRVRGQSVTLVGTESADVMQTLLKEYDAIVLMEEYASGVTSYYCYSPRLGDCVGVGGERVNLHIAVAAERCVVGTPIIFGGF